MREIFSHIESLFAGMLPFVVLVILGVYLSFKTRGFQFRKFGSAIKFSMYSGKKSGGGVSSFAAVCNSLAATVGTGNIAGVAAAISIGGAGAVFWMWISALLGACIKACEIVIALPYRKKEKGSFFGGPMYYIIGGLGKKYMPLAALFAFFGVFSAFTTGNITQINASVSVIGESFKTRLLWGAVLCVLVGFVIIGGVSKISKFTTRILPLVALAYILLCGGVIFKNFSLIDNAFKDIFIGAFSPESVTGGAVGSLYNTIITGAQKGVFSNEAGLGTAAMAHTAADDADIKTQGLFGVFEVFVDTLLICTLTALTILCSGVIIDYTKVASSELVAKAFSTVYGDVSVGLLAAMLLLFGVSSVIGWAAYGIGFGRFLAGETGVKICTFIYPLFCIVGAVADVEFAWRTAEFFNGIMLIINLFAVFMLSHKAVEILGEKNETKNRKTAKQSKRITSGFDF